MKTVTGVIMWMLLALQIHAQTIAQKLDAAVKNLEADAQMKSAVLGFCVISKSNGQNIYLRNADMGLIAASSQKILTSAASLELLGNDFKWKTELGYNGVITNSTLTGDLYIIGYGDPTLGSSRFNNTKEETIIAEWVAAIRKAGIHAINGNIIAWNKNFETQTIPGGWIWDDIGNYYGAGISAINWRENVYELKLKSGSKPGDKVAIVTTTPKLYDINLTNELITGKQGRGDNAYIYLPPYATSGFIRGTIPPDQSQFSISGAFPNPSYQLISTLKDAFKKQGIEMNPGDEIKNETLPAITVLNTHYSPPLDSVNNWFLKKSINLYGEALVKTLAYVQQKKGTADAGLSIIKNLWKAKGIDATSINMVDGSGLSPLNRVTAAALVKALKYSKSQPWFHFFYEALPTFNGIKMKSGTMTGVKSFAGYCGDYVFAIIVNNYNGSSNEMTGRLYKILDILK